MGSQRVLPGKGVIFIKGLVFDTENRIQLKDFGEPLLDNLQKEVGGYIEVVHPKYLPEGLCMVVDDEGLLKGSPVNNIASILYGTPEHGQPIAGKPENLKDFETLVFDTAGKLITLMGLWAIKQNPKYGQRDGSLSLKGYGFVGREFVRLMDYCFYELKKNIVVVFHATEEKDGDNTRLRIKVEGQTKNNVWEPMDLGGFVEMYGNDRTIGFSNCEKYFAKGTRGIHGIYKIPALTPGSQNDFLTKLFEEYNSKAAEEVAANAKENEAYEQVMQEGSKIIAGIKDADTANAAMQPFKGLQHHLTSSRELNAMWKAKIAALGLAFDSNAVKYVPKSAEEAQ